MKHGNKYDSDVDNIDNNKRNGEESEKYTVD